MPKENNLTSEPNIWKFGCNWGGRGNPSFYEFIKDEEIVIGRERCRYTEGDLVLITEGFTAKAIAKVEEEPGLLMDNPDYFVLFEDYNVTWDDLTICAKAKWYELSEEETFQYILQRGAAKIHQPEIKEKVIQLWNQRN